MGDEERFYVVEITKDSFGHEYEGLYQVCRSEEKAKEIADKLNDINLTQDNDDYYTVVSSEDW